MSKGRLELFGYRLDDFAIPCFFFPRFFSFLVIPVPHRPLKPTAGVQFTQGKFTPTPPQGHCRRLEGWVPPTLCLNLLSVIRKGRVVHRYIVTCEIVFIATEGCPLLCNRGLCVRPTAGRHAAVALMCLGGMDSTVRVETTGITVSQHTESIVIIHQWLSSFISGCHHSSVVVIIHQWLSLVISGCH